ncbi:MAG: hypothetical protein AB7L09_12660 [Nitrospira sp.]
MVIFVEVHREPSFGHEIKSASGGIRGVNVETGQVRWSGTARVMTGSLLVMQDTQAGHLAELTFYRAICPVETGRFAWIEQAESDHVGGCRQRGR